MQCVLRCNPWQTLDPYTSCKMIETWMSNDQETETCCHTLICAFEDLYLSFFNCKQSYCLKHQNGGYGCNYEQSLRCI